MARDGPFRMFTTSGELPETPPETGTALPFIWPPPEHLEKPAPFPEPVLPSPPSELLVAREMELDALRCEDPVKYQGLQVYDSLSPPPHGNYKRVRGATRAEDMPRWYVTQGPDDDTVLFESRFESGNLRSAEKIDKSEYNLQLAFDINTERHTQWFYFRMSNLRKARRYKLNMQNLVKTEAMYNLGMQPLAYSEMRARKEGVGWYRTGSNVCYFKNQVTRAGSKPFWTLSFAVQTGHDRDTLYLAHCFPYRYTDLQRYLRGLEVSSLGRSSAVRRRTLCQTLAGNDCDMLVITSPTADHEAKRGIVISARVHPGETNASWMMKGVLDYLTSDSLQAVALREKFVFKIVPMLNPDGVIVGNYRCSLAGGDLNRQYEDPKRELFPEVLNFKQMIANFTMTKEVVLFVDLHGHSKKSNVFMYGVENPTDEGLYMKERVIPTLLDRASPLFSLKDCSFDVGKGKEGCGRVVVRKQLGVVNAYTMEASFMGADQGDLKGFHFNQSHLESMGRSLCEVLLEIADPNQSRLVEIVRHLVETYPIDQSRVVLRRDGGVSEDYSSSDGSEAPTRLPTRPSSKPSKPGKRTCSHDQGKKEGRTTRGGGGNRNSNVSSGSSSNSNNNSDGEKSFKIALGKPIRCKTSREGGKSNSNKEKRTRPATASPKLCKVSGEARGVGTTKKAAATPKKTVSTAKNASSPKTMPTPTGGTPKKAPLLTRKGVGSPAAAANSKKIGLKTAATADSESFRGQKPSLKSNATTSAGRRSSVEKMIRAPSVDAPKRSARRPASSPASRSITSPRRRHASTDTAQRLASSAPPRGTAAAVARRVLRSEDGGTTEACRAKGGAGVVSKERSKKAPGKMDDLPLPPLRSKSLSASRLTT